MSIPSLLFDGLKFLISHQNMDNVVIHDCMHNYIGKKKFPSDVTQSENGQIKQLSFDFPFQKKGEKSTD